MTEEEMAEEYLDKRYLKDMGVRNPCKDAFLAGLKAGKNMAETDLATVAYMQGAERYKTKWHKVKSGDLPPEDTKVLAFMAGGEVCIAHFYRKNVWDKIEIVIAWCEIPKYTEE